MGMTVEFVKVEVRMDRKWMSANRLSKECRDGVQDFIRFVVQHEEELDLSRIVCPCLSCCYVGRVNVQELEEHLVSNGIDQSYTCWTKHGEKRGESSNDAGTNAYYGDRFEDMAKAIEEDLRDCRQMFEKLVSDAEKPLYEGSTKFTRL